MPNMMEVKIPDIGDFEEVAVIEVMVKPGDTIKPEDPLVTLESDKATMDVPSPAAGRVKDVKLKVGDKASQGSLILLLETTEAAAAPAKPAPKAEPAPAKPARKAEAAPAASSPAPKTAAPAVEPAPTRRSKPIPGAATYTGKIDGECEVLVLGAGPGGYSAAFRAADLGKKTVLVERYAALGGVCLNVGCIPSKALLHVAAVTEEAQQLGEHGVTFGKPKFDLARLREWKDRVVGKLTGGIGMMAKGRQVEVIRGTGRFIDPHHMEIALTKGDGKAPTGAKKIIRFAHAIIAAGSQAVKLPFIPEDPRIVDSTGALELRGVPKKMLVIGGGIIGLEMATVYSALGCRLDVVEMQDGLMLGADRDLVRVWEQVKAQRF
ncbi:MAG: FAD-dependent oxidoreductase, partial [Gammaproteobacteria bacterium]|nr:FAD-dependent oxidoreductase [Gammaproteobacteria bacterium]